MTFSEKIWFMIISKFTKIQGFTLSLGDILIEKPLFGNWPPSRLRVNYDNLSKNDRRFLELMEREAVKIDGNYQLPLPLKDKELVLPNNRMVAMKHMQPL